MPTKRRKQPANTKKRGVPQWAQAIKAPKEKANTAGFRCPRCLSQQGFIIDSRYSTVFDGIRRRRVCIVCEHRYTTYETTDLPPKRIAGDYQI